MKPRRGEVPVARFNLRGKLSMNNKLPRTWFARCCTTQFLNLGVGNDKLGIYSGLDSLGMFIGKVSLNCLGKQPSDRVNQLEYGTINQYGRRDSFRAAPPPTVFAALGSVWSVGREGPHLGDWGRLKGQDQFTG